MNIKLTYVNRAELAPTDLPTLLLFQKQIAGETESALIWKVIRNCRHTHFHPMVFSTDLNISLGDDFGNYSKLLPVANGNEFKVALSGNRPHLSVVHVGDAADGVTVHNHLPTDAFKACLFMRGQLMAIRAPVPSGEQDNFALDNTLWMAIGRRGMSDEPVGPRWPGKKRPVREGDPVAQSLLDTAIPIPLSGVASANIVMYGNASNLTLKLENIILI
ncbi:MAG TPA: hypothetical protein VNW52_10085 [Burkholderiaceae bacterium]|jgi:hypothetical protein|nr:hypothetical protein [Burkholderiaceae bacterium]